jgi:hypothetical protein
VPIAPREFIGIAYSSYRGSGIIIIIVVANFNIDAIKGIAG